ncbi:signal transduction histidine kinase [Palleronia aestuarii]|uniref:histidine kinase n=1 Tax=Palleronia aestuarii TaxID=568105 RepID=A0A2W7NLN8_9RHOB|nr:GAF domain-containing sensor histidine kinase [Palleronia aestuarii]PZX19017.1 signal transduction histidine kinase [Palleronia aestuarii]
MNLDETEFFDQDIQRIQFMEQVPLILDVCAQATGMGFTAIARVTEDRWITCASRDDIEFGLRPGDELDVESTICKEVRTAERLVVIQDVETDAVYCDHPTPKRYGFRSYISVPIVRASGEFFGTLCAIGLQPIKDDPARVVGLFKLCAQLVGAQIDTSEMLEQSNDALSFERETAKLREEFIAIVGHDLRNPIAALGAGLRLMERQMPEGPAHDMLPEMKRTVLRANKIIDNLLDFARGRMGEGIVAVRRRDVNLSEVIEDVASEIRAVSPHEVEVDLDLDRRIDCDPQRVGQLVSNLLSNAVTHGTLETPILVRGRTDEAALHISVENSGDPVTPEMLTSLFQPFVRGDRSSQNGLGLGLYISSQIARAHGGELIAESDGGKTTFTFVMPLEPAG